MGEVRLIQLQFSLCRLNRPAESLDGLLARTAAVGRTGLLDGRFARLANILIGQKGHTRVIFNKAYKFIQYF